MHLLTWDTYYVRSKGSSPSTPDAKSLIKVYQQSQNHTNNTSYIKIEHYVVYHRGLANPVIYNTSVSTFRANQGSTGGSYQTKSKSEFTMTSWDEQTRTVHLGDTYHTVYHNADGTGKLYVNGTITVQIDGINYGRNTSPGALTLTTIPRYANITGFNIWNNGLNQIGASWSVDRNIDHLQYSLSGGGWTDASGTTFYVGGLNPGTQYSLRIRVKSTASQLWTESGTLYATTTDKAKITNANVNLNVDNGINVTFSNPSGLPVNIFVETLNPTVTRTTRVGVSSPYNLQFTEAEKTALFGYSPNANNFTVRVGVITNGAYWDWKDGTASITNANPTFSNFDYADIGGDTTTTGVKTTTLTGNNQKIIKGYSNLRARVTTANKMIANKGSNAIEYQLVVGAKQIKENYSSSSNVDMILNAIDNNVFIVYAIDSRGNSTYIQKSPATYIDYFKPVVAPVDYERDGDIGTETTLKFNGSFFNETFGSQTNTISATYKYKRTNSDTWIDGVTPLVLTPSGNTFSCNQLIAGDLDANGFNAENSYDIEITVKDKLDIVSTQVVIDSGKPNMAFAKDGVAINQLFNELLGSGIQISGNKIIFNGLTLFEWVDE